ncbi:hypothetical protein M231_02344 [Tremella mesenterica]|uniref:Macro domain-containing protein n=1 Tax=Tremella mesenterica TaxID=5217 RepID=A0A4Q1BQY2_TREME|nr:uncharacterized protein TREMEDRAFT_57545 [Tremella mesenterica DSM 1558]EIW67241.1 hypothetical protein TREMEDRAFT_57545 [Tremella mesenterica DSM 1558]RXK40361.1 hypothetical protein M231_02344 [Tremella mesenterica]
MSPTPVLAEVLPTLADMYDRDQLPDPEDKPCFLPDPHLIQRVCIWQGDITRLKADMIVNAANRSLLGGGGVDGAIHSAAGPDLLKECEGLGGAETGETKVTKGYDLPAKYVAHTVGPIYSKLNVERSAEQLESCYRTSLEACVAKGGETIGFSSISTGVYGYPIIEATQISLRTTRLFLQENKSITRVIFVVFSEKDKKVYEGLVPEYFPEP